MDSSIITAMISLIGTLGGSLGGILVSSKLTAYRLEQLEAQQLCKKNAGDRGTDKGNKSSAR